MTILFGLLAGMLPIMLLVGIVYFIIKISRGGEDKESLTTKETLVDAGIFISLVTSVAALVSVLFSAIDKKFIDVLSNGYMYAGDQVINDDVRVSVSVILVSYPIYLALAYYRSRHLRDNPARLKIAAMKYVNYITLGVSAIFIVGSLITTIYEYLGGELGVAFFYKILTVVTISLALGLYNYFSLKRDYAIKSYIPHIFAVISLVAVISSVVYSISILGSPAKVRKIRFDEKRLQDMSNIQNEVLNYWTRTKTLPASMSDLQNGGMNTSYIVTKDPKSGELYEYKVLENSKMSKVTGQDCATYYPNKFNYIMYPAPTDKLVNRDFEVSKISCEIPTKAVFEICANFETVRIYDENGLDQTSAGWDGSNALGVKSIDYTSARYYDTSMMYDSYNKNPNWNHNVGNTCFKRTIDPLKYPQY